VSKKTKEVYVWVSKVNNYNSGQAFHITQLEKPGSIKAKLIIPVEPEVITMELDCTSGPVFDPRLKDRRRKCRFEEVVE